MGALDVEELVSVVVALLALLPCGYLGALALLAWPRRPPPPDTSKKIVAVVPAHNESVGIARTVQSLLACDYPAERRRVLVVADNCTDDTADKAAAAGAEVLVRKDDARRGKGYALEAAFDHLKADDDDAYVVVDADSDAQPNLFAALSARVAAGAQAMQVVGGVRNVDEHWRPRLLAIALAAVNGVRSLARERLGLSVGLRGNGWALTKALLAAHPHRAYGLVEDIEFGVQLGLAGVRVAWVHETGVYSELPVSSEASVSQRRRWEGGRLLLLRQVFPRVLRSAIEKKSLLLLDIAVDLLVPPLSYPALLVGLGVAVEIGLTVAVAKPPQLALALWALCAACLVVYVLRAVALSRTGLRGLFTLAWVPFYVVWKLVVARPWRVGDRWVRTKRAGEG